MYTQTHVQKNTHTQTHTHTRTRTHTRTHTHTHAHTRTQAHAYLYCACCAGVALSSSGATSAGRQLVSCIAPTTPERHVFHACTLYRCFAAQTHAEVELIVVDTGPVASPFFTTPGSPGYANRAYLSLSLSLTLLYVCL